MADREGAAAPNQRQGQNQQQNHQQSESRCSRTVTFTYKLGLILSQKFSGKPEEDAEAHLLHSNDWMNAHHF